MLSQRKIFISHTTQDERDCNLAHRLADGLKNYGAEVWIAPENIPAGSKWEGEIVSGIMEVCTHFLVIISAASISAKWVLKEINHAKLRHTSDSCFTILPLFTGEVGEFPNSDFIAQFQKVTYYDNFSKQLETVKSLLGLRPIVPDNYSDLIRGFVGREYVFKAIDDFLAEKPNGYFILVGDPGEGKSTILAEYIRRTGCVAHFNMRAQNINRTSQCLESICKQLIVRYGLPHISLTPELFNDGEFLQQILNEVSELLEKDKKIIISIDALDEIDLSSQPSGPNILFLPRQLPLSVFFVMTQRDKSLSLFSHSPQYIFDLRDYRDGCLKDIKSFIRHNIDSANIRNWIDSHKLDDNQFITILAEKSEFNFMYLHYVLPEIECGVYQNLNIANLPIGLKGYYEDHWVRMGMKSKPTPHIKIKIIYILAEVRQPVSRQLISEFANEDEITVQEVLDDWKQFLHKQVVETKNRYSVYHTSFRDFLHRKDIVQAAGVTIEGIHKIIAEDLWQELMADE